MTAGISYGAPTGASSLGDIARKAPRQYGPPRNPVPDTVRIPRDRGEWTDLTLAALRFLWDADYATASIGAYLGFSKNAVVGKAHRLDLPARPSPIIRDGRPAAPHRLPPPARTLPPMRSGVEESTFRAPPTPAPYGRVIECSWPLNDGYPWKFCDADTLPGKSYCKEHHATAYGKFHTRTAAVVPVKDAA